MPEIEIPEELPEGETFPRKYVEELRAEAAKHRTARKEAEDRATAAEAAVTGLQEQVFRFRVEQTGKLADATDLPFDAALLAEDADLDGAIDALLTAKPHLATRRVSGDAGQGAGDVNPGEISLAGLLSINA